MKYKKKIKIDIKQILEDSGVDKRAWEKCLTRLVNYTDKVRTGKVFNPLDLTQERVYDQGYDV